MKNKNIILSAFMYLTAGVLFFSYIVIFVKSFDLSNTSDEYRMFYKDKLLAYFLLDGELQTNYSSGTEAVYLPDGNYRNLGNGWGELGSEGTWTIGNDSVFYFYVDNPSANQLITINCVDNLGYNNTLYVNGNLVGDIVFSDGVSVIELSNSVLVDGINEFSIHTDDSVLPLYQLRPETDDRSNANLKIYSIKLEAES